MTQTWYVLEDGRAVHPAEVTLNADGRLAHPDGLVAMRDADTPVSRSVDPEQMVSVGTTREARPAPSRGKGYKTKGV